MTWGLANTSKSDARLAGLVERYGDLLFDLCESVLWSPANAQLAFRSILKALKRRLSDAPSGNHERAWTLRIACEELLQKVPRLGRTLSADEQIQLDAAQEISERLKNFDAYFHRLSAEDQILLLLKDKYGVPLPEIAVALRSPEGSLKIRRQLALRALEEWLWDISR
ncbi:MAG: hypothetical protein NDJ90_15110 [Oligoflexia bacterium]|nr:hypothetical protein [Oligoflexia bacterium]